MPGFIQVVHRQYGYETRGKKSVYVRNPCILWNQFMTEVSGSAIKQKYSEVNEVDAGSGLLVSPFPAFGRRI